MSRLTDQTYLATTQYKNADNLNVRIQLHERFDINPYDWHLWLFDHLDLPESCRILELGCGTGRLWKQNLDRIPDSWEITLSDFSPGMLQQAKASLSVGTHPFEFEIIDAQQIPWADASCDAVIANHMLYHVPDREQALREIRRILKPNGKLYAATNGINHLKELRALRSQMAPSLDFFSVPTFLLENGEAQLAPHFSDVTCYFYDNALRVTEQEPLVAYILSGQHPELEAKVDELRALIAQEFARQGGALYISKSTGLFEARKA